MAQFDDVYFEQEWKKELNKELDSMNLFVSEELLERTTRAIEKDRENRKTENGAQNEWTMNSEHEKKKTEKNDKWMETDETKQKLIEKQQKRIERITLATRFASVAAALFITLFAVYIFRRTTLRNDASKSESARNQSTMATVADASDAAQTGNAEEKGVDFATTQESFATERNSLPESDEVLPKSLFSNAMTNAEEEEHTKNSAVTDATEEVLTKNKALANGPTRANLGAGTKESNNALADASDLEALMAFLDGLSNKQIEQVDSSFLFFETDSNDAAIYRIDEDGLLQSAVLLSDGTVCAYEPMEAWNTEECKKMILEWLGQKNSQDE